MFIEGLLEVDHVEAAVGDTDSVTGNRAVGIVLECAGYNVCCRVVIGYLITIMFS